MDSLSDSAESAKRTAKNVGRDLETRSESAIDQAKVIAKDLLINKAEDAKKTLKTIGKAANAAGDYIG